MARIAGVVVAALVVVVLGLGLIVFALSQSSATAIVDLDVGDCFDLPADDAAASRFETVDLVDCDEPHQVEVVLVGELNPDGDLDYPDDDALFELAGRRCLAAQGVPLDRFGVVPLAPTEDTWNDASGRFSCLALQIGGAPSVGSLVGGG